MVKKGGSIYGRRPVFLGELLLFPGELEFLIILSIFINFTTFYQMLGQTKIKHFQNGYVFLTNPKIINNYRNL